jgi:FkbM family methyltransferase
MLINFEKLPITKNIRGIIHIGAHECEERMGYIKHFGINDNNTIWIDAIKTIVEKMKSTIPNLRIFNECISNTDNNIVSFMVTNNYQSSSMLNLKTHKKEHPHIHEIDRLLISTKTIQTFYKENNINSSDFNFMNLDIQGAELMALQGAGDILHDIDYIYTEVNTAELYEGCCLIEDIDTYLSKYNFKRVLTEMTQYGWGDAFYIKI